MKTRNKLLFASLALLLALVLPLAAWAMIVDDGTTCPADPAGWHNWQYVSGQEPNCQHGWIETYRCSNCGKTYTSEYGQKGSHDWQEEGRAPTCTQSGYQCLRCSVCGETARYMELPATGHDPQIVRGQPPSCTSPGTTDGQVCGVCGVVLEAQKTIAALGHDFRDDWYTTKEATCTASGTQTRYCHRCKQQETRSIAALGHNWSAWQAVTAATCTSDGQRARSCSRCGKRETETISAIGHDWTSWRQEYPGTCVKKGMNVRSCRNCGKEEYVYTDYGDHDWGAWQVVIEPTFTEPGIEMRFCKNDPDHVEEREIPALNPEDMQLALTLEWLYDAAPDKTPYDTDTLSPEDSVFAMHTVTNTGDVPLNIQLHTSSGAEGEINQGDQAALEPGSSFIQGAGIMKLQSTLDPGSETEDLLGTVTFTIWYIGLDPATGKELCQSNKITRTWKVAKPPVGTPPDGTTPDGTKPDGTKPDGGNPDGTLPEEKAELTLTVLTKDGEPPYGEKTEFKPGEKYWFHTFIENTGNVDVELYDCDKAVNGAAASTGYSIGSRYLLKPGEKVDSWDGYYLAGMTGWISETSIAPGTETETLAGTVTFSATVRGYKPGTDEVICTAEGSATVGLLKEDGETPADDGPHPDLSVVVTADADAGVGKRYEGAVVPFYITITNTGDCTVYVEDGWDFDEYEHVSTPHGVIAIEGLTAAALDPGESMVMLHHLNVTASDVETGTVKDFASIAHYYYDQAHEFPYRSASSNKCTVDLTYPEGGEPEAPKPELTLTVTQNEPEKEAYTYTDELIDENCITNNVTVINTGNVPLNFQLIFYRDDTGYVSETGFESAPPIVTLAPGESWNRPAFWYYVVTSHMTPDPEDSPYAGTATCHFEVEGYDVETWETVCVSNSVSFTHKIAKPGPAPWPIPSLSAMTAEVKVSAGYESSDPSGYQLGEKYGTHLITENTGSVAIPAGTIHVYDPYDGWTDTWYSIDFEPGQRFCGSSGGWNKGTVTEEDVARGYIFFPPVEFTWEDPDSGETRHTTSNALTLPVISKTGLLLEKTVANTPAEGGRFQAGETIQWKLTVTNTGNEPIKNITVRDQGLTVGAFDRIEPGETRECAVPGHEVTEYDAFVGKVINQAVADGYDLQGAQHTWNSNIAPAYTGKDDGTTGGGEDGGKTDGGVPDPGDTPDEGTPETPEHPGDPGGGHDKLGDPDGLNIETSIYKTTAHGPENHVYYQLGETVDYTITITNTGDTLLENVTVIDSLYGLDPVQVIPLIAPGASETVTFQYKITQHDIDVWGYVVNQAGVTYAYQGGKPGTPQKSNKVYVYAGTSHPFDPDDTDKDDGTPTLPGTGEGDFCAFALTAMGGGEIRYTLHACAEHTEAAKNAEAASANQAVSIWQAEIDKLYEALYEDAQAEARAAVMNDRAAFLAYADAYKALYGDEALAGMLRLRCAELCCMRKSAPAAMPDSVLGEYAAVMNGGEYAASERVFGALDGSDCEVTVKLTKELARTLEQAVETVRGTTRVHADKAFAQVQQQWQMTLDSSVNAAYKAADKETRKAIIAWRKLLDEVVNARKDLLSFLYPNSPETVQEAIANLYRDAAVDAN